MSEATVDDLRYVADMMFVLGSVLLGAIAGVGSGVFTSAGDPLPATVLLVFAFIALAMAQARLSDGYCRKALSYLPGWEDKEPLSERSLSDKLAADAEVAD